MSFGGCLGRLSLKPIKGYRYYHEQETLHSLLSTGWFQVHILELLNCNYPNMITSNF